MSARVPTAAGPRRTPARAGAPSTAELAAEVLRRGPAEPPAPGGRPWRGRAADEALLLIELCRWLEGCNRQGGWARPAPVALADVFVGLARRRAPLAAVRGFVRTVVRHAHAVLAGPYAPPDARFVDHDADIVVELLELCFQEGGFREGPG